MVTADKAYINGKIYCVKPKNAFVEAVAIKDGKFIAIGSNECIKKYTDTLTELINLHQKTVLPGLQEPHIHAVNGSLNHLFRCHLPERQGVTLDEILDKITQYTEDNQNNDWIIGGNWPFHLQEMLHKDLLDDICSERPLVFYDFSTHNVWVNSKTLEIAGIDENSPNPEGGEIVRDSQGKPTGILLENAVNMILSHIPQVKDAEVLEAALKVSKYLNSFGYTTIKDPAVDEKLLKAYQEAVKEGMSLRVATCLLWKSDYANNTPYEEQVALVKRRKEYENDKINPNFVKIFIDGVPAYKTAAFIDPYLGESIESHCWQEMLLVDPDELKKDLVALDKEGITVKMHATGDAAIKLALDAIETARLENGYSGLLHEVAHNGFIKKADIPRFKKLEAIAEFSPPFWYPSEFQVLKEKILGKERAHDTFPIKSVYSSSATVVCGSDWPIIAEPNPWTTLESLVTRSNPYYHDEAVLNPQETLEMEEALELYTINAAKSMYQDDLTGSIEEGKLADMIILNQDIFSIHKSEIGKTKVIATVMEGKEVYSLEKSTDQTNV